MNTRWTSTEFRALLVEVFTPVTSDDLAAARASFEKLFGAGGLFRLRKQEFQRRLHDIIAKDSRTWREKSKVYLDYDADSARGKALFENAWEIASGDVPWPKPSYGKFAAGDVIYRQSGGKFHCVKLVAVDCFPTDNGEWWRVYHILHGYSFDHLPTPEEVRTPFGSHAPIDPAEFDEDYSLLCNVRVYECEKRNFDEYLRYNDLERYLEESGHSAIEEARRVYSVGSKLHDDGDLPQAIDRYKEAIEIDPAYWKVYDDIAFAYRQLGDFRSALMHYDVSLEFNPHGETALFGRANCLRALGRPRDALEQFQAIHVLLPFEMTHKLAIAELRSELEQYLNEEAPVPAVRRGEANAMEYAVLFREGPGAPKDPCLIAGVIAFESNAVLEHKDETVLFVRQEGKLIAQVEVSPQNCTIAGYKTFFRFSVPDGEPRFLTAVREFVGKAVFRSSLRLYSFRYQSFLPYTHRYRLAEESRARGKAHAILNGFGLRRFLHCSVYDRDFCLSETGSVHIVNKQLFQSCLKEKPREAVLPELHYEVATDPQQFTLFYDRDLLPRSFYEGYQRSIKVLNRSSFNIQDPGRKVFIRPFVFSLTDEERVKPYAAFVNGRHVHLMDMIRRGEDLERALRRFVREELKVGEDFLRAVVRLDVEFDRDREGRITPRLLVDVYLGEIPKHRT